MRIENVSIKKVAIPIEAPILTAFGSLGLFTRTLVTLTTESGLSSTVDVSARYTEEMLRPFVSLLRGTSIWDTSFITNRVKYWNYYPWVKPEPIMGTFEIAMLDLQAKAIGEPFYRLLGGKIRDEVPVACYTFWRHANEKGYGQIASPEAIVEFAKSNVEKYGFEAIKLKGGYFEPSTDVDALVALYEEFGPEMRLRLDPQGAWTPTTAIRMGRRLEKIDLEYYEDPVWGSAAMAEVARHVRLPLATNMCVTQFEELNQAKNSVAVVLSDLWYWGGVRATMNLDRACSALGLDIGMHSGTELGFGWAAMIHTAAAMPTLQSPIDYLNMHLVDDIIKGGKIVPKNGMVRPPEGPGLGVEIDEEKVQKYLVTDDTGPTDRFMDPNKADSARPGWFPTLPSW